MQSRRSNVVVSAPGKLMVVGEYAVLGGAEAVVAAVDRRAYARTRSAAAPEAPAEARAAYRHVAAELGDQDDSEPTVDVSSMRSGGIKLGLGSSAAAAAAAAGLAFAQQGLDIESMAGRARVFDAALRGHSDIAPQGSGADVAAAVHGGVLRFRRHGTAVDMGQVAWPAGLRLRIVWTGQEARTSTFLARVSALEEAQPSVHRRLLDGLGSEAERFVQALVAADIRGILRSTAAYGQAMGELGRAAGIPIVNETLRDVAELAHQVGGAAKPSGAGGGDVALAVFPDDKSEQRFDALCRERNFTLLLIEMGAPGVRLEGGVGAGEATA